VSKPLRVLSISTLFPSPARPAFGKFVANQMAAVRARGDVDLVIVNPVGLPPWPLTLRGHHRALAKTPAQTEFAGSTVHHPRFLALPGIADGNPARMARAILPLVRKLHAERPFDLVDAQFFFPDGPAARLVAKALNLPFCAKARGSDIHYWGKRPAALVQILAVSKDAAGMLAVSQALGRDMAALGLDGGKIRAHYTGLDHTRFRPMPRAEARVSCGLDLPSAAPLFVSTGALIAIKGQALAIEALAQAEGAHLALAGSGENEAALRALAAGLGLEQRVHFLGQVSHDALPVLIAAADAMVLPSEREGLANAWIEALACGTPLIIPAIGGAREVVTGPAAGRIVPRDPGAIAAAMLELATNPPMPADVAAHAARFIWEASAAELVAFWREIAA